MKPKQNSIKKKEVARRKNRTHWMMHKNEITARRSERKFERFQQHVPLPEDFSRLEVNDSLNVTDRFVEDESIIPPSFSQIQDENDQFDENIDNQNEQMSINMVDEKDYEYMNDFIDENDYHDDDIEEDHMDNSFLDTTVPDTFERKHDEKVKRLSENL